MKGLNREEEAGLGLVAASAVLGAVSYLMTGCGGVAFIGTSDGVREWGRYQNGQITEGKTSPNKRGAYWQNEDLRERETTKREAAPSFLSRLMGGDKGGAE